jgi:hypothetical protein
MGDPSEALSYLENTAKAVTRKGLDPLVEPVCITNQQATTKMMQQICLCKYACVFTAAGGRHTACGAEHTHPTTPIHTHTTLVQKLF